MIARIMRTGRALLLYTCAATLLAEAIFACYVAKAWNLDRDRVVQMLAVAYGIDLFAIRDQLNREELGESSEQVSYTEILAERALKSRDLELREQALRDALAQLRGDKQRLAEETRRYEQVKTTFDEQLASIREHAAGTGMDDNRAKLEAIKPAQAKELLVAMIRDGQSDDVVTLLREMSTMRSAKIIGEFKTPEEIEQIGDILERIREGGPEAALAASAEQQSEGTPPPSGP